MSEENGNLKRFEQYLFEQEKSRNTIEKYVRDVKKFLNYCGGCQPDRENVIQYKSYLQETYKVSSTNSMLIALNCYLRFIGKADLCIRTCRQQRRIFCDENRKLRRNEYQRLVMQARKKGNIRLCGVLQTIASTGIRVGELKYITVEALKERKVQIDFKGKSRTIILPRSVILFLKDYCRKMHIQSGSIFVTKNGRPLDRRMIWAEMKALCEAAKVRATKVFPHNLRHLFAECFYEREKDLMRLADYLGHSSVETTRRYTMLSSEEACERQLDLGLLIEI